MQNDQIFTVVGYRLGLFQQYSGKGYVPLEDVCKGKNLLEVKTIHSCMLGELFFFFSFSYGMKAIANNKSFSVSPADVHYFL